LNMIAYTIKHHVPGRIRIEIPGLKKMTMEELKRLADVVTRVWRIEGIRDISANPVTGSMTIKYDPAVIDIMAYLSDMAADQEINNFIKKGALHALH
jgi:hypothetical protein